MIGDGIEAGYLAPSLNNIGVSHSKVAFMFTVYGMAAVFAARLSGALADILGPRIVMLLGLWIWAVLEVVFLVFGVAFADRNIICNLALGVVGDRVGWRKMVAYVGGLGCTITTLLLYYLPVTFPGNYPVAVAAAMLYGATLAGYAPLSAITGA